MPALISIGRLIDETWELYRTRFHEHMTISGWLLLLAIFFTLSLSLYPSASTLWYLNELTWSEYTGVILFILTNYVIAPLLGIWVMIGLVRLVRMQRLMTRGLRVKKATLEIKPRFLPTILVSIMVGLLLVVAILIGMVPTIILTTLGGLLKSSMLVMLGNLLLLIGIFVSLILAGKWMIEYMLAPYATMLDDQRGKRALQTVRQLVKGRFWSVLIRLAIPKLVFIFIGIVMMGIIAFVTEIMLSAVSGMNVDLFLRLTTLVEWTIPVVIAVLINPLIIIADVLLYQSLKGEV